MRWPWQRVREIEKETRKHMKRLEKVDAEIEALNVRITEVEKAHRINTAQVRPIVRASKA